MKTVLITGCSGYIGTHLSELLKKEEYLVFGLDVRKPEEIHKVDHFLQYDINKPFPRDEDGWSLFDDTEFDAVIHLAAKNNEEESKRIPIQYYITNLNGTMNCLSKLKTKNFIFTSTTAADECKSAYGLSKRAAETCVIEYCTLRNPKSFSIFRFDNLIGPDICDSLLQAMEKPINDVKTVYTPESDK